MRSDVAVTGRCLASTSASLWAISPVQMGNWMAQRDGIWLRIGLAGLVIRTSGQATGHPARNITGTRLRNEQGWLLVQNIYTGRIYILLIDNQFDRVLPH